MPIQAYYEASTCDFVQDDSERILGVLATKHHHATEQTQRDAWKSEIEILKGALQEIEEGRIFLELYIPRMGKRVDALLISGNIVFILEFKVGAHEHSSSAIDQVVDYALDLKNFHQGSHRVPIVPVLISTHASTPSCSGIRFASDLVAEPISTNASELVTLIRHVKESRTFPHFDIEEWSNAGYRPTPTIVEAAQILYRTHNVSEISRHDAGPGI